MREHNDEDFDPAEHDQQPVEAWESDGRGPDDVAERYLSYIEHGSDGTWHVTVKQDELDNGRRSDRSFADGPEVTRQYVSKGNFGSYKRPYPGDELGDDGLRWPVASGDTHLF